MNKLLTTMFALGVACVTLSAGAQAVTGNAVNGGKKTAMCVGCHGIIGYQASFPEIHKVPMIAGQNAKYLVAALQAYAKGERKHPTMKGIASSLSEQDMAEVAAFYEQQAKLPAAPESVPAAPANVAELLTKGACVSCHGANFSKPIDPSYPKLGGQHADYLTVALKAYKIEKNNNIGRSNPIMAGQVKQFSNAELKAIASYISSLPTELATVPQGKFR
jgi:cytochrome c553